MKYKFRNKISLIDKIKMIADIMLNDETKKKIKKLPILSGFEVEA